jgi:excisionase family DNA binding protein
MPDRTTALYVRLPHEHAERLHRAAAALATHKKDLVAGLVEHFVDPDRPESLERLRAVAAGGATTGPARRIEIDLGEPGLTVGHHAFRPAPPAEVLDLDQAAELLRVDRDAVAELAESGELPGRRIGGEWRFAREALLAWLAAGAERT